MNFQYNNQSSVELESKEKEQKDNSNIVDKLAQGKNNSKGIGIQDQMFSTVSNFNNIQQRLELLVQHIYEKSCYKYYILSEAPHILSEAGLIPDYKKKIFGDRISDYDLSKNYSIFFEAMLGKLFRNNSEISFSYCDMLIDTLKEHDYLNDSYVLKKDIDYGKIVSSMKQKIRLKIIAILTYMAGELYNKSSSLSSLFMWKSKRKILENVVVSSFAYKHPFYNAFISIKSDDLHLSINKVEKMADLLINGKVILCGGHIIIPEDFGLDIGMNEISSEVLLNKFVNRCFQELIQSKYYNFFVSDDYDDYPDIGNFSSEYDKNVSEED